MITTNISTLFKRMKQNMKKFAYIFSTIFLIFIFSILIYRNVHSLIPGSPHDFSNKNLLACMGCHSVHYTDYASGNIDKGRMFWPGKGTLTDIDIAKVCFNCHNKDGADSTVAVFKLQGWAGKDKTCGDITSTCHFAAGLQAKVNSFLTSEGLNADYKFIPPDIKSRFMGNEDIGLGVVSHHPMDTATIGSPAVHGEKHSCLGCHTPHGVWDSTFKGYTDTKGGKYPLPKLLRIKLESVDTTTGWRNIYGTEKFCLTCHDLLRPKKEDNTKAKCDSACHLHTDEEISGDINAKGYYNSLHIYKFTSHETKDVTNDDPSSPSYEVGTNSNGKLLNKAFMFHKKRRRSDWYESTLHRSLNRYDNPYKASFRYDANDTSLRDIRDISCLVCHETHGSGRSGIDSTNNLMRVLNNVGLSQNDLCYQCHDGLLHQTNINLSKISGNKYPYRYYRKGMPGPKYGTDYITTGHKADKGGNTKGHGSSLVKDYLAVQTGELFAYSRGMLCAKCHEPHGTGQIKLLRTKINDIHRKETEQGFPGHRTGGTDTTTPIYTDKDSTNMNYYCYGCHKDPAFSYLSALNGVPIYSDIFEGTNAYGLYYNGKAPFELSAHDNAINSYESIAGLPSAGCRACHDPHGTNNPATTLKYQEKLCFDCHYKKGSKGISTHGDQGFGIKEIYETAYKTIREDLLLNKTKIRGSMHTVYDTLQNIQFDTLRRVECVSCHNTHTATRENPLMDPDLPANSSFSTTSLHTANEFCFFKCHSGDRRIYNFNFQTVIDSIKPYPRYRKYPADSTQWLSLTKLRGAYEIDIRGKLYTDNNIKSLAAGTWGYYYDNPIIDLPNGDTYQDSKYNYGHLTMDDSPGLGVAPQKIICVDCHEVHASKNTKLLRDNPTRYGKAGYFSRIKFNFGFANDAESTVSRSFCYSCHVYGPGYEYLQNINSGESFKYYKTSVPENAVNLYATNKGFTISPPTGIGWMADYLHSNFQGYVKQHETTYVNYSIDPKNKEGLCVKCHYPHNPRPVYSARCLTDGKLGTIGYMGCHNVNTGNPYDQTFEEFFGNIDINGTEYPVISKHSVKYNIAEPNTGYNYASYKSNECGRCHPIGEITTNINGDQNNYGHDNHGINYSTNIYNRQSNPLVRDPNARNNYKNDGNGSMLPYPAATTYDTVYSYSNVFCLDCHGNLRYANHNNQPYTYSEAGLTHNNLDSTWPYFSGPDVKIDTNGDEKIDGLDRDTTFATDTVKGYVNIGLKKYNVWYKLDKAFTYSVKGKQMGGHGSKYWSQTNGMLDAVGKSKIRTDITTFDKATDQYTYEPDGGKVVLCMDCHEQHGSALPKNLKVINTAYLSKMVGKNNAFFCMNCHSSRYGNKDTNLPAWPGEKWTENTKTYYYESSVHGYGIKYEGTPPTNRPTGGAWDSTLHGNIGDDAAKFTKGGCTNCHDPHGRAVSDDDGDQDGIADSTYPSMLVERDEKLCYLCHSNADWEKLSVQQKRDKLASKTIEELQDQYKGKNYAKNMKILFDLPQIYDGYNTATAHEIYDYQQENTNRHGSRPSQLSVGKNNSKIECTDCHNPHSMRRVNKMINGVERVITSYVSKNYSDQSIDSTARSVGFCLQCHNKDSMVDTNDDGLGDAAKPSDRDFGDGLPDSSYIWGQSMPIANNANRLSTKRVRFWNKYDFSIQNGLPAPLIVWDKSTHDKSAQGKYTSRKYKGNSAQVGEGSNPDYPLATNIAYDWSKIPMVYCIYCHDPHGSKGEKLIRSEFNYNITRIPTAIDSKKREQICLLCHDDSGLHDSTVPEIDTPLDIKSSYYLETTFTDGSGGAYFDGKTYDGINFSETYANGKVRKTESHHRVLYDEQVPPTSEQDDGPALKLACYSCHDHHKASSTDTTTPSDHDNGLYAVTDPYVPHNPMRADVFFCLRCHDKDTAGTEVKGVAYYATGFNITDYIPTLEGPGSFNDSKRWKSAFGVGGALKNKRQLKAENLYQSPYITGGGPFYNNPLGSTVGEKTKFISGHSIQATGISVDCVNCHDSHGSSYGKMIRDKTNKDSNQRPLASTPWQSTYIKNIAKVKLVNNRAGDTKRTNKNDFLPQSSKAERCLGCHSGGTMYFDQGQWRPIPIAPPGSRNLGNNYKPRKGSKEMFYSKTDTKSGAHGVVRHPNFKAPDTTDINETTWIRKYVYAKPILRNYNQGATTRKGTIWSLYSTTIAISWDSNSVKADPGWACDCHVNTHNPYVRATSSGYVYACYDCHGTDPKGGIPPTQLEFEPTGGKDGYSLKSKHPIKVDLRGYESARVVDTKYDENAPLYIECLKCHIQMPASEKADSDDAVLYHMTGRIHLMNPLTSNIKTGGMVEAKEWYPTKSGNGKITNSNNNTTTKRVKAFYDLGDSHEFDTTSSYGMPAINNFCLHCHYIKGFDRRENSLTNGSGKLITEDEWDQDGYKDSPYFKETNKDSTMIMMFGKDPTGASGPFFPPQLPDGVLNGAHFNLAPGKSLTKIQYGANKYNEGRGLACTDCHEQHASPARGLRQQFLEKNLDESLPYYYLLQKHTIAPDYNKDLKKDHESAQHTLEGKKVLDNESYCNYCHGNNLIADRANDYGKKEDDFGVTIDTFKDTTNLFIRFNGAVGKHHAVRGIDKRGEDGEYGSKYTLNPNDPGYDDMQVDCTDCHNVHVVQRGKNVVTRIVTDLGNESLSASQQESSEYDEAFCLQCHGYFTPKPNGTRLEVKSTKINPIKELISVFDKDLNMSVYDTAYIGLIKFPGFRIGDNTGPEWKNGKWNKWNKSAFESTGHQSIRNKSGGYDKKDDLPGRKSTYCANCHDPHGSSNYRMLKEYVENKFVDSKINGPYRNIRLETTRVVDQRLRLYPRRDYPGYESSNYAKNAWVRGYKDTYGLETGGLRKRFEISETINDFCYGCHEEYQTYIPEFPGKEQYNVRDFGMIRSDETDPYTNKKVADPGKRKLCVYCHNPHGTRILETDATGNVLGSKLVDKLLRHDRPIDMRREDPNNPGHANSNFGNELFSPNAPSSYRSTLPLDSTGKYPANAVGNAIIRQGTPFARRGGYIYCNNTWCHVSENIMPENYLISGTQNNKFYNLTNRNLVKGKTMFDGFDLNQGTFKWGGSWQEGDGKLIQDKYDKSDNLYVRPTSFHPLKDGRMYCVSCHYAHGSPSEVTKFNSPGRPRKIVSGGKYVGITDSTAAIPKYQYMDIDMNANDDPDLRGPYFRNKYWPFMFMQGVMSTNVSLVDDIRVGRGGGSLIYLDSTSFFAGIYNNAASTRWNDGGQMFYEGKASAKTKHAREDTVWAGQYTKNLIALKASAMPNDSTFTYAGSSQNYRINPPDNSNELCFICHKEQDIIGIDPKITGDIFETTGMRYSNTKFIGHESVKGGARISNNISPLSSAFKPGYDLDENQQVKIKSKNNEIHLFSCSRCHRPHSTRNEKLLATRCFSDKKNYSEAQEYKGGYGNSYVPYFPSDNPATYDGKYEKEYDVGVRLCHKYANGQSWPPLTGSNPVYMGWRSLYTAKKYFIRPPWVTQFLTITEETREGYYNSTALSPLTGLPITGIPKIQHTQNDVLLKWKLIDTTATPNDNDSISYYVMYVINDSTITTKDPKSPGMTQTFVRFADRGQTSSTEVWKIRKGMPGQNALGGAGFDTLGGFAYLWMPYADIYKYKNDTLDDIKGGRSRAKYWFGVTAVNASGNESLFDFKKQNTDSCYINVKDTTPPMPIFDSTIFKTGIRYNYVSPFFSYYDTTTKRGLKVVQTPGERDVEFWYYDPYDNGDIVRYTITGVYESTSGGINNSIGRSRWDSTITDIDTDIKYTDGHKSSIYTRHNPNKSSNAMFTQFRREPVHNNQYWFFTLRAYDANNQYSSTMVRYRVIDPQPAAIIVSVLDLDTTATKNGYPFNKSGTSVICLQWNIPRDNANANGDPKYGGSVLKYNIYRKALADPLPGNIFSKPDLRASLKYGGKYQFNTKFYTYESTTYNTTSVDLGAGKNGIISFYDMIPNTDRPTGFIKNNFDNGIFYHYVITSVDSKDQEAFVSNEILNVLMPKTVPSIGYSVNPLWGTSLQAEKMPDGPYADSRIKVTYPDFGAASLGADNINAVTIRWRRDGVGEDDVTPITELGGFDSSVEAEIPAIYAEYKNLRFKSRSLDTTNYIFNLKNRKPGTYSIALFPRYSDGKGETVVINYVEGTISVPTNKLAASDYGKYTCYVGLFTEDKYNIDKLVYLTKIPEFSSGDYFFFEDVLRSTSDYKIIAWIDKNNNANDGTKRPMWRIYTNTPADTTYVDPTGNGITRIKLGSSRTLWNPDYGDVLSKPVTITIEQKGTTPAIYWDRENNNITNDSNNWW